MWGEAPVIPALGRQEGSELEAGPGQASKKNFLNRTRHVTAIECLPSMRMFLGFIFCTVDKNSRVLAHTMVLVLG